MEETLNISKAKSEIVVLRMTPEMVEQLEAIAYKNKTQKTKVIVAIVSKYLQANPPEPINQSTS